MNPDEIVCGVLNGKWWSNPPTTTGVPRISWWKQFETLAHKSGPGPGDFTVLLKRKSNE